MAYDIETARVRVGLQATDSSQDVTITAAMDAALGYAEKYCDREFMREADVEAEFIHFDAAELQLRRFPVAAVASVDDGTRAIADYHLNAKGGRIVFDSRVRSHVLKVKYTGGYEILPADLEMALWRLFDNAWSAFTASAAGGQVAGGAIKAIRSNGASIEYDTSAASSGGSDIGDPLTVAILDLYAVQAC